MKYRVTIRHEDGTDDSEEAGNMADAVDFFANATEDVLKEDTDSVAAMLEVDGVVWGMVKEPEAGEN